MEIALVVSPGLSGHRVTAGVLLMLLPFSSTSLKKGRSLASNTQKRFIAGVASGLTLVTKNYLQ
jgi:hypothetical protein